MPKFLSGGEFKLMYPKHFDLNKYNKNRLKCCVLEIDFKYPKKLCELHNYYPLGPDKIEIKKGIFSKYQLMISDSYKIPIGNVKIFVPDVFDKEKYVLHYGKLKLYLRLGLKLKKCIVY